MALTITPVFGVNVSSLSAGTLVAAILDKEQRAYDYFPSPAGSIVAGSNAFTWPSTWNGVTIVPGTTNATAVFPAVVSASLATATDPAGTVTPGQLVLNLRPAAGDVVNASSVMNFRLDPEAVVLTVSGTFSSGANAYGT